MTTKVVTDDTLGVLGRRYHELFDRVRKGVLDPQAVLDGMQTLIEGAAPTGAVVDLVDSPFCPDGCTLEEHRRGGSRDLATAKLGLYLSGAQERESVVGHDLRKEVADKPVLNANDLDFLLKPENQHLITEDWKEKKVFFWGTIYRCAGGSLYVRCLCWHSGSWGRYYCWLGCDWRSGGPAAVVASSA
jgi:hypothetical protein